MNRAIKAAIFNSQSSYLFQRAAFFHSTPVLEYKRRNNWQFGKRHRRMRAKQELLRNFGAYTDVMFESWKAGFHEDDPSSSTSPSWSKKQHNKGGSKRDRPRNKGFFYRGRRPFEFCEDIDDDIENIFRSAFGGSRFFYWSFVNEEYPQWRRSRYSNNYERSWSWSYRFDEDSDSSTESGNAESSDQDTIADRRALGLSASGPLTLDVVKTAYRACALKWHPDRHHGSSKAVAEEKFKLCNSAYQSLCEKLALN
ncbi:Brz-insensitive-long hypocotyls 2 [Hibiscus trionum]|uniref:Brz-insensitive-long hypocotyls 2 n=1 Tax=Hibiscus trionum TaxID=183268 RepID=A0A9W7H535_HIBTR|nr:Brz-insensitive-long hypocotyls 2 [Hibiscus trionum]